MSANIPQREPIGDLFTGVVLAYHGAVLLALEPLPEAEVVAQGDFVVRYGIRYLEKPFLSIVPGLLALDYGDMLTGEAMWRFILTKHNSYPRADVVGYRNDGRDEMIVLKKLDLDQSFEALVFDSGASTAPLAKPTALIAAADSPLPERLTEYVPRFDSLEDWEQTATNG